MELIKLLMKESTRSTRFIVITVIVSGVTNALLVALTNKGASAAASSTESTMEFLLFIAALVLFMYTKIAAEGRGRQLIEQVVLRLRKRVFKKLMKASVSGIETMDNSDLISKTSLNISHVLQSADGIIYGFQAMVMVISCSVYLLFVSVSSFVVVLLGVAAIAVLRHLNKSSNKHEQQDVIDKEGEQAGYVNDLLDGFNELKINQVKRTALYNEYLSLVDHTSHLSTNAANRFIRARVMIQGMFFVVLAGIVFIIPTYTETDSVKIMEVTAIVLFIVGFLTGFLEVIPIISKANASLNSLREVEAKLDDFAEVDEPLSKEAQEQFADFNVITTNDLYFSYGDQLEVSSFTVGPVDLNIKQGETLFLVGGNGSGKSTLIKLITGLYHPTESGLEVDGVPITIDNVQSLRENFAIILTDFHLFDRFYGYSSVPTEQVVALIKKMELDEKVTFENGRFSTLKLSTGQRKRLALIVALIENKQIYVFDEWAADQDQHFRRHFYDEILTELKQRGKTVIAVTHDDKFWDRADRVVRLDYGKIEQA